ncbi:MAG TPA: hypothetical protein VK982_00075 [Bacteroidales bacterium]|nr:hypothetical protein [Bacteroidales bacterium]
MIITFEDTEAGLKAVNLDLCFAYNLYEDEKAIYFFNRAADDGESLVGVRYWNEDLKFLRKIFKKIIEEQVNDRNLFDITEYYIKYLKEKK